MTGPLYHRTCGFAHDQFGIHLDGVGELFVGQFLQQRTRRESAHVLQRLTNRRQAENDVRGRLDIVEAEHGDVLRHLQSCIVKRSYAADGGDVVKTKHRREVSSAQQQLVDSGIAELRGVEVFVKLNGEVLGDLERERACHLQD